MSVIYIVGTGTFVNTGAIVGGGIIGYIFQRLLNEKLKTAIMQAIGRCRNFYWFCRCAGPNFGDSRN
ncbi:DUF554 family protein [Loigolactobacillus iwatensis]|uniref:DUF554 family protein n=1 Tax=Loigolactobacillus iwatensis TaxID=1267156 RepID=UPI00384E2B56